VGERDEITALVYRYAELLDGGDIDGVVALFADATWRSAATGTVLRSQEEIRAVYDRIMPDDGTPKTQHLMSNLIIDLVEGADEATGRCYYTVLQGRDAGEPIDTIVAGRYVDRYRRGAGGWKFADRLFIVDLPGGQSREA
jgi:3-phenylpropionate/cinnamic acid dioxygenase small subunit